MSDRRPAASREIAGAALLVLLGIGPRLLFVRAFPTMPFWDSLQLIHFGELMRSNGVTAPGWYWSQFNPGVPMVLALLFESGLPHAALARLATACATGLLGVLPFLIWRDVIAFRWRLLAGALLALWPGQIFFSGVVVQDNWVLPPMVALACLAVRRLRSPRGLGWPVLAAILLSASFAIRQEMLVALLPVALAAGISRRDSGRRPRDAAILGATLVLLIVLLCLQRREATGRFTLATEHGALGLFGSFMPGAGAEGWIDGRAYAAAREPSAAHGLFGSPGQLLRLTAEEVKRRPGFHALRIASWLPRLALGADADALLWSLGAPRALAPAIRPRADAFLRSARPLLAAELALVQGAFAAALLVGLARRRPDILVLASAVGLKFAIHMVVSPLGRLVIPAVALELIAIPLGAEVLKTVRRRERLVPLGLAAAVASGLLIATPPLAALVARRDSRELHGVRSFRLDAGEACWVRCDLRQGALSGLTPASATFSGVDGRPGTLDCSLPVLPPGSGMELETEGGRTRVLVDGQRVPPSSTGTWFLSRPDSVSAVSAELPADDTATVRFRVTAAATPEN